MPDRANAVKGLTEIAGYMLAKADIAGVGQQRNSYPLEPKTRRVTIKAWKEQEAQNGYEKIQD